MTVIRTSLKIERDLLKEIKDVAFDKDLNQNDVIIKYLEYCVKNGVEI